MTRNRSSPSSALCRFTAISPPTISAPPTSRAGVAVMVDGTNVMGTAGDGPGIAQRQRHPVRDRRHARDHQGSLALAVTPPRATGRIRVQRRPGPG